MTLLSVNVNKIATLRNARGHDNPNLISFCKLIISKGIKGITVHPRPDERHIRIQDVKDISILLSKNHPDVEFNIEGYPFDDFINLVIEEKAHQCTLVPDPPEAITSNAGWKLDQNKELLKEVCTKLKAAGVRSSLFIDPFAITEKDYLALTEIGCHRVELYTEKYAQDFLNSKKMSTLEVYSECSKKISRLGIEINAGHDLDQENLGCLIDYIPVIKEVSIGHALVCEALIEGFSITLDRYKKILNYID